jgi:hypothetical protein
MNGHYLYLFIFLGFFYNTLLSQNIDTDNLIKLKRADFSEESLQKLIIADSLLITIDELLKLKKAGIGEKSILKLAIKKPDLENLKSTLISSIPKKLNWDILRYDDIDVTVCAEKDNYLYNGKKFKIRDIIWSANDDTVVFLTMTRGFLKLKPILVLINPVSGEIISILEKKEAPVWMIDYLKKDDFSCVEGRIPTNAEARVINNRGMGEPTRLDVTLNDNELIYRWMYDTWGGPNYFHMPFIDTFPNGKILIKFKDSYLVSMETQPPYSYKRLYNVVERNNFETCEAVRISNNGKKIAVGIRYKGSSGIVVLQVSSK